ncbi:hypothetical protein OH76DRAFT_1338731 [Lentinus brumalis]|uniref:DUF4100 domain-containing protein n=1 Tax=Lentinus brumalis TaxID=2498619 RepID=A0A371DS60_9APHY|nr:hypothetical protein OH76DRAFT_1338731 [Polyporus brumalis]
MPATGQLPLRDDKRAPRFKGKKVEEFIAVLEYLAESNTVGKDTLPKAVSRYVSSSVRSVLSAEPAFEGSDWEAAKKRLRYLYGSMTQTHKASPKRLRRFVKESFATEVVSSHATLDRYNLKFSEKAGNLVRDNAISQREIDELFYQGLPKKLRRSIMGDLGKAVHARTSAALSESNPPSRIEILDTARAFYKADAINGSSDSDSDSGSSAADDSSDPESDDSSDSTSKKREKKRASSLRPSRKSKKDKSKRERTRSHSDTEVTEPSNDFTRQFQAMAQNFMRDMMLHSLAPSSAAAPVPTPHGLTTPSTFPLTANVMPAQGSYGLPRRCYVCGKTEGVDLDHALGTKNCPETARLLAEKLASFSPMGRLSWPDGSPLPNPNLLPGGYATFIRDQRAAANAAANSPVPPVRDLPPHQTNVMRVGLCRDGTPVFSYPPSASSSDVEAYSFPVTTRSGAKAAPPSQPVPVPSIDPAQPPPAPTAPPKAPTAATSTPRQNTEIGWNDMRRDKSRAVPVPSQDRSRPARSSNLRFSSAIQDSVSIADVEDHVLNTKVTLTLRECLGMSANLQKRFGALVKTRREFDKPDDAQISTTRKSYSVTVEDCPDEDLRIVDIAPSLVAELSFEQGRELLEDVLERYAASVSLGNIRQFAMVSGTVECIWGGQKVVLLIDTGSELNLIGKNVFDSSGLGIDEDGARWSLRGIGGSPIALLGCVRDAPVQLAGKNFDHHFFVSSVARGIHDGILGQPWLSFFSAQFDYARDGTALLRAYPSGNRDGASITLEICKANHPRNADRLVLTASVEEVPNDEDF